MIGIYKYTNKINGKIYIGQSINIHSRQLQHKSNAYNKKAVDYNSYFHKAIRKYGIENFNFEILEIVQPEQYSSEKLNKLEEYYIKKYKSFEYGYNATTGGQGKLRKSTNAEEKNSHALLTKKDVKYIRECYNAHIPFRQIYKEYENKITKRGLQKIWYFQTWKNICPEYNTKENKYFHSHQAKANPYQIASQNKRAFTEEQVKRMREEYYNGKSPVQIWKEQAPKRSYSTIYNLLTKKTYKNC